MMTTLNHLASSWLPKSAARYAAHLISLGGEKHHRSYSWGGVGEIHFDNALSKRLLLDRRMEEVWRFLSEALEDIENNWIKFLAEVQLAAKGPELKDLRSPSEHTEDITKLSEALESVQRILNRYGVNIAQVPVGCYFDFTNLESLLDDADESYAVRGGNNTTLKEYHDELVRLVSRQQALIKKPGHSQSQYQYFIRKIYEFFMQYFEIPNRWKILSIIASVSLEKDILPSTVKGTCQDL